MSTTEQRVIATKPKIGARPAAATPATEEVVVVQAKSRKKTMIIVAALVAAAAAAYWFLMGPGAAAEEAPAEPVAEGEHAPPTGEPGDVMTTEPISINLAGGHYLRLGLGLQFSADAGGHGKPSSAQALDAAIALFSGRDVTEVNSAEGRAALKEELLHTLWDKYHGDVLDVYFTDYVTQ